MVIFDRFLYVETRGYHDIENEPKKLLAVRPRPLKVALKMRPSPWLSRHGAWCVVRVGGDVFFFFANIFLGNYPLVN